MTILFLSFICSLKLLLTLLLFSVTTLLSYSLLGSRPIAACPITALTIQSLIRKQSLFEALFAHIGLRPIETIAQAALSEQAPSVSLHNRFCMALNSYIVLYFAESVNTTCSGANSAAIASATRIPSMAAEVMPPAYPAPSPQG